MGPLGRRLRALERRVGDRDFNAGGPPLAEDGLPDWDGPGLNVDSYKRLLNADTPNEELSDEEIAARDRLSPYAAVFARLAEEASQKTEELRP